MKESQKIITSQTASTLIKVLIGIIVVIVILALLSVKSDNEKVSDKRKSDTENVSIKSNNENVSSDIKSKIEDIFVKIGFDKEKIIRIMPYDDWNNGPMYKVDYDNELFFVYAYDNGEIVSIKDIKLNSIYDNTNAKQVKDSDKSKNKDTISLIYNELGEYGKEDKFGKETYIRYYVPAGAYKVKALTRNAQFFIEKIKISKNSNGYYESKMVKEVQLGDKGSEDSIKINSDECILLTLNSNVLLEKE